jgi:hypothetical protein
MCYPYFPNSKNKSIYHVIRLSSDAGSFQIFEIPVRDKEKDTISLSKEKNTTEKIALCPKRRRKPHDENTQMISVSVKCYRHKRVCLCSDIDRLCGLVIKIPGYRSRGSGFDSRRYHIFREVVGLEWGPPSLVRIIDELL